MPWKRVVGVEEIGIVKLVLHCGRREAYNNIQETSAKEEVNEEKSLSSESESDFSEKRKGRLPAVVGWETANDCQRVCRYSAANWPYWKRRM